MLTPREVEILTLVKEGYTDKQIAEELGIAPETVKNHLSVIYIRLGVKNRTEAVVTALRMGIIELEKGGR